MKELPNQSGAMSRALYEQWLKTKSGVTGLASSMVAEPVAGLNALFHGDPELVHHTREHLTYGDPSGLVPENFMMPEAITQGAEYFNQSADQLGEYSPLAGAALRTAPAFVAAMASPALRGEPVNPGGLRKMTEMVEKVDNAKRVREAMAEQQETPEQKRNRLAALQQRNTDA